MMTMEQSILEQSSPSCGSSRSLCQPALLLSFICVFLRPSLYLYVFIIYYQSIYKICIFYLLIFWSQIVAMYNWQYHFMFLYIHVCVYNATFICSQFFKLFVLFSLTVHFPHYPSFLLSPLLHSPPHTPSSLELWIIVWLSFALLYMFYPLMSEYHTMFVFLSPGYSTSLILGKIMAPVTINSN